jgi:hypothetical protein
MGSDWSGGLAADYRGRASALRLVDVTTAETHYLLGLSNESKIILKET